MDRVFRNYEELDFAPLAEGSPVQASLLWGNPETGPAALFVKFPEGFVEPFHSHSSTYHAVVVRGSFSSKTPDNDESGDGVYGPGSTIVQPGGQVHAELNASGGEAVALVVFDGPVDFVPAD